MNHHFYLLFALFIGISASVLESTSKNCLWSTYRPGPYFGLRSTTPNSPLFGFMWYYPEKMDSVKSMRHFMEISDNIDKYEWQAHNGCNYGKLRIEDTKMNVSFEIEFFNEFSESNGSLWTAKIVGKQIQELEVNRGITLLWYISNPSNPENKTFGINYDPDNKVINGVYKSSNDDENISFNKFQIKAVQADFNKHPVYDGISYDYEYYLVLDISEDKLYDPSEYIVGELKSTVGASPNHLTDSNDSYRSGGILNGNVFVEQNFFIEDFRVDIHFFDNKIEESKLNPAAVDEYLDFQKNEFTEKFSRIFENKISSKKSRFIPIDYTNLNNLNYPYDNKPTAISALCTLFSNLIYMYGNNYILDTSNNSLILSQPMELLTIGPDKTSHSRGFMWDEGFQQRILSLWNLELSLKVLENWFSNIDENTGWMAREQMLDNESRARAPPSSWASNPDLSNPPSLFLFINHLLDRDIDEHILKDFLNKVIVNMEKNAKWYINTQKSSIDFVFSWKGKSDDFCLPSGLDDYPRCRLNGNNFTEGHIDLQSWMISLSKTMVKIYSFLNKDLYQERIEEWQNIKDKIFENLLKYFWDEENNKFNDFYIDHNSNKIFSQHTGYLQLFPLILDNFEYENLESNSKYVDKIVDLIINIEKGLRTDFGVRSLSVNDSYYKKGKDYWTGPIWININYLILKSLNTLKNLPDKYFLKKEYSNLRFDVVNNMVRNFEENGYIWEVYDDMNGNGKYNHPFTGWSALIVNLIYEMY